MSAYNDEHFLSSYLRLRKNPNYNDLLETPAALPAGYMGDGGWTRKEESALI